LKNGEFVGDEIMEKIPTPNSPTFIPEPVVIIGANVEGKPNFLTVSLFSIVNFNPLLVAFSSGKKHYTNKGIEENRTFSVNIPTKSQVKITDHIGLVTGEREPKDSLFTSFYGTLKTAPLITETPINLECKLTQIVELPTNNLYIGEVISTKTSQEFLTDNRIDLEKVKPILLSFSDLKYWTIGEDKPLGKAFNIGLK